MTSSTINTAPSNGIKHQLSPSTDMAPSPLRNSRYFTRQGNGEWLLNSFTDLVHCLDYDAPWPMTSYRQYKYAAKLIPDTQLGIASTYVRAFCIHSRCAQTDTLKWHRAHPLINHSPLSLTIYHPSPPIIDEVLHAKYHSEPRGLNVDMQAERHNNHYITYATTNNIVIHHHPSSTHIFHTLDMLGGHYATPLSLHQSTRFQSNTMQI